MLQNFSDKKTLLPLPFSKKIFFMFAVTFLSALLKFTLYFLLIFSCSAVCDKCIVFESEGWTLCTIASKCLQSLSICAFQKYSSKSSETVFFLQTKFHSSHPKLSSGYRRLNFQNVFHEENLQGLWSLGRLNRVSFFNHWKIEKSSPHFLCKRRLRSKRFFQTFSLL